MGRPTLQGPYKVDGEVDCGNLRTKVLEQVGLAEEEGQALFRRRVHVSHDSLVLHGERPLLLGENPGLGRGVA